MMYGYSMCFALENVVGKTAPLRRFRSCSSRNLWKHVRADSVELMLLGGQILPFLVDSFPH